MTSEPALPYGTSTEVSTSYVMTSARLDETTVTSSHTPPSTTGTESVIKHTTEFIMSNITRVIVTTSERGLITGSTAYYTSGVIVSTRQPARDLSYERLFYILMPILLLFIIILGIM